MSSWPPYPNALSEEESLLEQSLSEAEELNDFWRHENEDEDENEEEEEDEEDQDIDEEEEEEENIGNDDDNNDDIFAVSDIDEDSGDELSQRSQATARPTVATTTTTATSLLLDSPVFDQSRTQRLYYGREHRKEQGERLRMASLFRANRLQRTAAVAVAAAAQGGQGDDDDDLPQGDVVSNLVHGRTLAIPETETTSSREERQAFNVVHNLFTSARTETDRETAPMKVVLKDTSKELEKRNEANSTAPQTNVVKLVSVNQRLYPYPLPYCPQNMVFGEMNTYHHVKTLLTPCRVRDYELIDSQFLDLEYLQEEIALSERTNFSLAEIAPMLFPGSAAPNTAASNVVKTASGSSSIPIPVAIASNNEQYRVFMRLCRYKRSATVQQDYIPSGLLVILNGRTFRIPDPARRQSRQEVADLLRVPFDLTEQLRTAWTVKHEAVVTFRPLVDSGLRRLIVGSPQDDFYFGVYLMKRVDFDAWWNGFVRRWTAEPLSPELSLELAKDSVFSTPSVDRVTVSLQCPMTGARIGTPCRSTKCTSHLQCFDGQTMIIRNQEQFFWRCPLESCGVRINLDDLFIDGLFLEILSVASASCDQAEVFRDGQWRCINKELDFTVTLIAPKEEVKEEMVKREKVSQPRSAPGTTKINRTMSLPSSSSQSSKSSKMDDAQLICRMAEGVSRVVKITEKEEQDEATDKALKVPNDNASLIKSKKRSAEVKSTSPFKPNIPLKRSSRVIKPTKTPEFSYML